jgi:hypothetical protein
MALIWPIISLRGAANGQEWAHVLAANSANGLALIHYFSGICHQCPRIGQCINYYHYE